MSTRVRRDRERYAHPAERVVAAAVLAAPLLVMLTYRSVNARILELYSPRLFALILAYALAYACFLASYRASVPAWLDTLRTWAVIFGLSVLLFLGASEVALRVLTPLPYAPGPIPGRHKYDPDTGHVYFPNHTQVLENREWRQLWHSNAQGVRADLDYGPKRAGVTRILVLGDSFTVGDQVSLPETYPGVLQGLLDQEYGAGTVEVINAGFPGYGTVHEARYLEKFGLAFEPDIVVLGVVPNDFRDNLDPLAVIARDGALVRAKTVESRMAQWRRQQRWYSLYGQWQRSLVGRRIAGIQSFGETPRLASWRAFLIEQDEEARAQQALAEEHALQMQELAESIGAQLLMIVIPLRGQLREMDEDLDPAIFGARWRRFAADAGIPFLDLYPVFKAHPDPFSLYWELDYHCTAAGNAVIGSQLFPVVRDLHPR